MSRRHPFDRVEQLMDKRVARKVSAAAVKATLGVRLSRVIERRLKTHRAQQGSVRLQEWVDRRAVSL